MKITRETDYAIRCILYMSKEAEKIFVVNDIAEPQQIPKSFLAKILQKLAKAGIVEPIRGMNGGFQLAKKPGDINLLEVIKAIQGPIAMNVCAIDRRMCRLSNTCSVHPIWVEIRKEVEKKLRKENFAKLTEKK